MTSANSCELPISIEAILIPNVPEVVDFLYLEAEHARAANEGTQLGILALGETLAEQEKWLEVARRYDSYQSYQFPLDVSSENASHNFIWDLEEGPQEARDLLLEGHDFIHRQVQQKFSNAKLHSSRFFIGDYANPGRYKDAHSEFRRRFGPVAYESPRILAQLAIGTPTNYFSHEMKWGYDSGIDGLGLLLKIDRGQIPPISARSGQVVFADERGVHALPPPIEGPRVVIAEIYEILPASEEVDDACNNGFVRQLRALFEAA